MLLARIGTRFMAGGEAIVDVTPMIRRDLGRIDAERFDGVDKLQHPLNGRPAVDTQQDFTAGPHEGQGLVGIARCNCANDVEA